MDSELHTGRRGRYTAIHVHTHWAFDIREQRKASNSLRSGLHRYDVGENHQLRLKDEFRWKSKYGPTHNTHAPASTYHCCCRDLSCANPMMECEQVQSKLVPVWGL